MPRPEPQDEKDRRFLDIIDRFGWHVMQVHGTAEEPPFSYSTGIFERTGSPEVILIGLLPDVAKSAINEYGKRLVAGERFEPGSLYMDFLEGHPVTFLVASDPKAVSDYATWTDWYYDRQPFPLVQLVYPDSRTGAFPWQTGYREAWIPIQPLLGPVPSMQIPS
jgi:Domain of unknown function (DUF4262)